MYSIKDNNFNNCNKTVTIFLYLKLRCLSIIRNVHSTKNILCVVYVYSTVFKVCLFGLYPSVFFPCGHKSSVHLLTVRLSTYIMCPSVIYLSVYPLSSIRCPFACIKIQNVLCLLALCSYVHCLFVYRSCDNSSLYGCPLPVCPCTNVFCSVYLSIALSV